MTRISAERPPQRLNDTHWDVEDEFRDQLFGEEGFRLEEWQDLGLASLVKSGAGRSIYRVCLPGLELFVKHFRKQGLIAYLRSLLQTGRAQKEFELAGRLRRDGVQTIRPIALGIRQRGLSHDSYLLTQAIADGMTIYELIEEQIRTGRVPFSPRDRKRTANELAKLAATIHNAGWEHRDLHERNIIVQPDGEGFYRFYLLDLHELRVHSKLPWRLAVRELRRMGRYFTLRTSRTDRYRFFVRYASLRGIPAADVKRLAREVEWETIESRADFWRRRDSRPAASRSGIRTRTNKHTEVHADASIDSERLRNWSDNPERILRSQVRRWWKMGRGTRVAEIDLPELPNRGPFILKQYLFRSWVQSIVSLIRDNQATRAWNNAWSLQLRELPTPQPVLLVHRKRFGMVTSSYLVTERVANARTIREYLDAEAVKCTEKSRQQLVRTLTTTVASLFRKLHDRRVTHRDLKATNILTSPTGDPGRPRLWLVDLDAVQTWQTIPEKDRLQNLARFHVSFRNHPMLTRTDRLRFLRVYLGESGRDKRVWKRLWIALEKWADRKALRNKKRGRVLA